MKNDSEKLKNDNIKNKQTKIKHIDSLIAILITVIFMISIMCTHTLMFKLNDDATISGLISGKYNGNSSINGVFVIFPLTWIIKTLYDVFTGLNWYVITMLFLQVIFYGITLYKMIKIFKNYKSKIVFSLIISMITIYVMPGFISTITFTEVSIFLMGCSLVTYLIYDGKKSDKILIIIEILFAFCLRKYACYMCLILFIPIGIYKIINNKKDFKKNLFLGIEITIIIAIVLLINSIINYRTGWNSFLNYNEKRSIYYDFYLPQIIRLESSKIDEIFEKSGISEENQELLLKYYIGLDNNTIQDIDNIINTYKNEFYKNSFSNIRMYVIEFVGVSSKLLVVLIYTFVLDFEIALFKSNKKKVLLMILLATTVLLIISCIIYKGRIRDTVIVPLYYILILINIYILFSFENIKNRFEKIIENNNYIYISIIIILILAITVNIITNRNINDIKNIHEYERNTLYKYFKENENNLYIQDVSTFSGDDYIIDLKENIKSINYISIGGWSLYSPAYYKKLEGYGVNNMLDLCYKDNVYIVEQDGSNIKDLAIWDDNTIIEKVDEIDAVYTKYNILKVKRKN